MRVLMIQTGNSNELSGHAEGRSSIAAVLRRSSRFCIYFFNYLDFAVKSAIMVALTCHNELTVETFRQHLNASRLSLSFSLVLALVCFFGSQVSHRVEQQPLSVASQLWYSVAANQSLFGKRIQDNAAFANDLSDDAPSALAQANHTLPQVQTPTSDYPLSQATAPSRISYQRPLLRAPPVPLFYFI